MRSFLYSLLLTALVLSASVHGFALPRKRATVCNGRAELCDRRYGNITFLAAHNSFAFSSNPLVLARTQAVDIETQLAIGARALQGQAHMKDGKPHFCHTTCGLFDGGLVLDYLKKVKTFLDANPNEVFTFIFTNPEDVSPQDVWKPIFDEAGITPFAHVPSSRPMKRNDWPTLREMIDSNKRVVVFLDRKAADAPTVDFILPEFQMVWEDPFSSTDKNFPCSIDRIEGPLGSDDHLNMINHNLNRNIIPIGDGVLVSDPVSAPITNGITSILAHANGCAKFTQGRAPNFVLLDYIDLGQPMAAVNRLNGF